MSDKKTFNLSQPQPYEFLGEDGFAVFATETDRYGSPPSGRQPAAWSDSEAGAQAAADFMNKVLNR